MRKIQPTSIKQRPMTVANIDQKLSTVSISNSFVANVPVLNSPSRSDSSQVPKKQSYKKAVEKSVAKAASKTTVKSMRQSNDTLDLTSASNVKHLNDIKKSKVVLARENSTDKSVNHQSTIPQTVPQSVPETNVRAVERKKHNTKDPNGKYMTLTGAMLDQLNLIPSCELMLEIMEAELRVDIRDGASMEDIAEKLRKFCRTNSGVGYYDTNNRFNEIVQIWFNYIQGLSIEIKADINMERGIWRHHISTVLSVLE